MNNDIWRQAGLTNNGTSVVSTEETGKNKRRSAKFALMLTPGELAKLVQLGEVCNTFSGPGFPASHPF